MKLCFTGMNAPIELDTASVSVLEVHNEVLFSRLCLSLQQEMGEEGPEPYSWWSRENNESISPHSAALFIASPLVLPWEDRRLAGSVASKLESLVLEDMSKQTELETLIVQLGRCLNGLAYSLSSNYSIDVDWDMKRCLKAFAFKAEVVGDEPLFDRCIHFLSYIADSSVSAVLVFVNLKHFFIENELIQLYEHAFFHNLRLLLLEQTPAEHVLAGEKKYIIDQDFIESWSSC